MIYLDKERLKSIFTAKAEMALGTPKQVFYSVVKMIDKLPGADFPEGHCKCCDCKCYELMKSNNQHFCNQFGGYVTAEDYCSRGRRK